MGAVLRRRRHLCCQGGRFVNCLSSFQMSGRNQERLGVMSTTEVTRIADDESIFEVHSERVGSALHRVDWLSVGPIPVHVRYPLPWHTALSDALGHALPEHDI